MRKRHNFSPWRSIVSGRKAGRPRGSKRQEFYLYNKEHSEDLVRLSFCLSKDIVIFRPSTKESCLLNFIWQFPMYCLGKRSHPLFSQIFIFIFFIVS